MDPQIEILRRRGMSVKSIAKLTGADEGRVAANLGVLWDGEEPIDRLARDLDPEGVKVRQRIVEFCERAIAERLNQLERRAIAVMAAGIAPSLQSGRPDRRTMERVLMMAAELCGTTPCAAASRNRNKPNVRARWVVMFVLYRRGATLLDIAHFFGLDHTATMHGLKRIKSEAELMAIVAEIEAKMAGGV